MFNDVNVSVRVLVCFLSLILVAIAVTAFSMNRIQYVQTSLETMNAFNSVKQRYSINFRGSVHDRAISVRDVTLVESEAELQAALDEIQILKEFYADSAVKLDEMFDSNPNITDEERAILQSIKEIEAETIPHYTEVIRLQLAGQAAPAKALLLEKARPGFTEWLARINQFIDLQESKNATISAAVDQTVQNFNRLVLTIVALGGLLCLVVALWCAGAIRALNPLTEKMHAIAGGDLNVDIPKVTGRNEIGRMASALEIFRDNARETDSLREQQDQQAARNAEQRRREMADLANRFQERVGSVVAHVSAAASQVQNATTKLEASSSQSRERAATVSVASEEASANVQAIASAADQLTSAIAEVANTITGAAEMARRSAEIASASEGELDGLNVAIADVDAVIGSINDVAEQTNLLALNATIEAARAGEMGKGFAVVASEVKGLAGQTKKMTETIAAKLDAVRNSASSAIESTRSIIQEVQAINDTTSSIAAAVEEQSSATTEISRSTKEAANGAQDVTANIQDVSAAAENSQNESESLKGSANELSQSATQLEAAVASFLDEVRAA
ncbi:MAG: methyl-accepting chemotaxis protein [Pseudomonadota bacterium]